MENTWCLLMTMQHDMWHDMWRKGHRRHWSFAERSPKDSTLQIVRIVRYIKVHVG